METLVRDLKYGVRVLLKNPGFAAVAVIVLALGIGANTAIFSVVNAVLLRPLPFQDPGRLVQVWHVPPAKLFQGMTRFSVSAANYLDWQNQNHVFDKMAIYSYSSFNLTGKSQPESVAGAAVSQDFFSVLRSQPRFGRPFVPDEDRPGHSNVVILSHVFWQNHFGADPKIVGERITLNDQSYTVVGVMPARFRLPSWAQVWTPMAWTDKERAVRGEHHSMVIARLKPGVELKQAQAEMNTISHRLEQQYPEDDKGWGATVISLREEMVGDVRPTLLILLGAVAFVLLIACANVANLVLARTLARQKEIAIRGALGATRVQVLRQIISETLLLGLAGGVLGLFLAHFGIALIVVFLAGSLPRSAEIRMDAWVLGFTLIVSVFTGIIAGFVPALRLTKTDLNEALKQGLGRTDADSGSNRMRGALVISEVALSLVLLIGAGLMIRSLWTLRSVDPGLDPHNVLTMTLNVAATKFPQLLQQSNFFNDLLRRVRALPGVGSAGLIDDLPLNEEGSNQPIGVEGHPPVPMAEQPEVAVRVISPGYLSAMRIPVLKGRDLSDADTPERPAALISESMAQRFWPNENPIGKHVTMTFFPDRLREIVGVVGDVKQRGLKLDEPVATLYFPLSQMSPPGNGGWQSFPMTLVVRTSSQPNTMVSAITNAVHQADPQMPVVDVTSMEDYIADSLSSERFNMLLLAVFAGLALLLAAIGTYSVLSYSVRRRVPEIGIRMALGAQTGDVLRMILGQGIRLVLCGTAIGLLAAFGLTRLMASQLFGVSATDPLTFFAVALALVLVALAACYLPARCATRVDPMVALRYE